MRLSFQSTTWRRLRRRRVTTDQGGAERLQQVEGRGFAAPPQARTLTARKLAHGAACLEDQPVGQVDGGQ